MSAPRPEQPAAYGVRIDAQPGRASIRLNGEEVPREQVAGYTLHHHSISEELPTLLLNTRQPDGIVWEGLARVAVATESDPAEAITAFLSRVDAAALDRAALAREDLGPGRHDVTRAILAQLIAWANGREV